MGAAIVCFTPLPKCSIKQRQCNFRHDFQILLPNLFSFVNYVHWFFKMLEYVFVLWKDIVFGSGISIFTLTICYMFSPVPYSVLQDILSRFHQVKIQVLALPFCGRLQLFFGVGSLKSLISNEIQFKNCIIKWIIGPSLCWFPPCGTTSSWR